MNSFSKNKGMESKTVKDLRDQLGVLGAKKTGNRETLRKRLDNWLKNDLKSLLVSAQPFPADDDSPFENPRKFDAIEKIDKRQLDWLTFECTKVYFTARNALHSFKEGRKLHIANHLRQIGFAKTSANNVQIRCFCKAAMKKGVQYRVVVELSMAKKISKSTCHCPAGQGNSAACKHVAALLICLECFLETGTILTGASCTSELQMWHKPPKLNDEDQSGKTIDELFGSSDVPGRTPSTQFTKFAVDASLNYGLLTSFNKGRECNMIALYHDHDYTTAPFKDYLDQLNMVSKEEIINIEKETISQSSSSAWFEYRKSRLTASNIHSVITTMETSARTQKPPNSAPSRKNFEKFSGPNIPSLAWGRDKENIAFKMFVASHQQYGFRKCGLFIDHERNYLAGSPDGISICGKFILEIKAPYRIRDKSPSCASYWDKEGNLKRKHPYFSQVQYQMHITGANTCFFVVYTEKGIQVQSIDYDENFISSTIELIDHYYKYVFCEQYCIKFGIKF